MEKVNAKTLSHWGGGGGGLLRDNPGSLVSGFTPGNKYAEDTMIHAYMSDVRLPAHKHTLPESDI